MTQRSVSELATLQVPPLPPPRILVVDDELGARGKGGRNELRAGFCGVLRVRDMTDENLSGTAEDYLADAVFCSGQDEYTNNNPELVMEAVKRRWPKEPQSEDPRWAMILVDLQFPSSAKLPEDNEFGARVVERITNDEKLRFKPTWPGEHETGPCEIPILMLSSRKRRDVESTRGTSGSLGFFEKPTGVEEGEELWKFRTAFCEALQYYGLIEDGGLRTVKRRAGQDPPQVLPIRRHGKPLYGRSLGMLRLLMAARRQVLRDDKRQPSSVLILGERGTGKGQIAEYMHDVSFPNEDRKRRPFTRLAADATTDTLWNSAIFGHVKGAFTDAKKSREGAIKKAGEGSLFIDEIGNVPIATMRKLLGPTGEWRYSPVGDEDEEKEVKCQLYFATNKPVAKMITKGEFPDDLYDRMDGILHLPSLRDLGGDTKVALFTRFIKAGERKQRRGKTEQFTVSPEVLKRVRELEWWGNIREMQKTVERIVSRRRLSGVIALYDLEQELPVSGGESLFCPDFTTLLEVMRKFEFHPGEAQALEKAVQRLDEAYAHLVCTIIEAAVSLTENAGKGFKGTNDKGINCTSVCEMLGIEAAPSTTAAKNALARLLQDNSQGYVGSNSFIDSLLKYYVENLTKLEPKTRPKAVE